MSRNEQYKDRLSAEIRRQASSEGMRRFLRSLPAFSAESTLPARFNDLLDELSDAEQQDGRVRQ
jgi:hypothetical protein